MRYQCPYCKTRFFFSSSFRAHLAVAGCASNARSAQRERRSDAYDETAMNAAFIASMSTPSQAQAEPAPSYSGGGGAFSGGGASGSWDSGSSSPSADFSNVSSGSGSCSSSDSSSSSGGD